MKPEIKAKWLQALRSGDYKQGTGALRKSNTFCCLGVLCDLAKADRVGDWDESEGFDCGDGDIDGIILPYPVREWAGLPNRDPDVVVNDEETTELSSVNDSGSTFEQIANYIEESL